jgi:hypothetical protein
VKEEPSNDAVSAHRILIRIIAFSQLVISLTGFVIVPLLFNYGGGAANPAMFFGLLIRPTSKLTRTVAQSSPRAATEESFYFLSEVEVENNDRHGLAHNWWTSVLTDIHFWVPVAVLIGGLILLRLIR